MSSPPAWRRNCFPRNPAGRTVALKSLAIRINCSRHCLFPLLAAIGVSVAGCNYRLPSSPERFSTTAARIEIHVAGEPLREGWVTLMPMNQTRGDPMILPIPPSGLVVATKVGVGPMQVQIHLTARMRQQLEKQWSMFLGRWKLAEGPASAWTITTRANTDSHFVIDLLATPSAPTPVDDAG